MSRREDLPPAGLAKLLGVPASTVTRWEADLSAPTGMNLVRLCEALGVAPDWIMRGNVEPSGERPGAQTGEQFLRSEQETPRRKRGKG